MSVRSAIPAPEYRDRLHRPPNAAASGPRVQATFRGEVIADSFDALYLDAVYYFPRLDVRMERLQRSQHETFAPATGYATYYSIRNGPENASWSYEDPDDRMCALEGRIAFAADKVSIVAR